MYGSGVVYAPSISGTTGTTGAAAVGSDNFRQFSGNVWKNCDWDSYLQGYGGYAFYDDFLMAGNTSDATVNQALDIGQWAAFVGTNGVVAADPKLEGGVLALGAGANSGVSITMSSMAGSFQIQQGSSAFTLNNDIWFECRVAVDSITSADRDCFIGLVDNTTTQVATAADTVINSSTNTLATAPGFLGFHFRSTTNPSDVGVAFNIAGGTVQYPTNLQTLVNTVTGASLTARSTASGFVKLGFIYSPFPQTGKRIIGTASSGQTAGNLAFPLVRFFVNGQETPAFLTSTNVQAATFPASFMSPTIAYKSRSTNSNNFNVDWIRVAAKANS